MSNSSSVQSLNLKKLDFRGTESSFRSHFPARYHEIDETNTLFASARIIDVFEKLVQKGKSAFILSPFIQEHALIYPSIRVTKESDSNCVNQRRSATKNKEKNSVRNLLQTTHGINKTRAKRFIQNVAKTIYQGCNPNMAIACTSFLLTLAEKEITKAANDPIYIKHINLGKQFQEYQKLIEANYYLQDDPILKAYMDMAKNLCDQTAPFSLNTRKQRFATDVQKLLTKLQNKRIPNQPNQILEEQIILVERLQNELTKTEDENYKNYIILLNEGFQQATPRVKQKDKNRFIQDLAKGIYQNYDAEMAISCTSFLLTLAVKELSQAINNPTYANNPEMARQFQEYRQLIEENGYLKNNPILQGYIHLAKILFEQPNISLQNRIAQFTTELEQLLTTIKGKRTAKKPDERLEKQIMLVEQFKEELTKTEEENYKNYIAILKQFLSDELEENLAKDLSRQTVVVEWENQDKIYRKILMDTELYNKSCNAIKTLNKLKKTRASYINKENIWDCFSIFFLPLIISCIYSWLAAKTTKKIRSLYSTISKNRPEDDTVNAGSAKVAPSLAAFRDKFISTEQLRALYVENHSATEKADIYTNLTQTGSADFLTYLASQNIGARVSQTYTVYRPQARQIKREHDCHIFYNEGNDRVYQRDYEGPDIRKVRATTNFTIGEEQNLVSISLKDANVSA